MKQNKAGEIIEYDPKHTAFLWIGISDHICEHCKRLSHHFASPKVSYWMCIDCYIRRYPKKAEEIKIHLVRMILKEEKGLRLIDSENKSY